QLLRPQLHQLVRSQPGIGLDTVRSNVLWRDRNARLRIHPATPAAASGWRKPDQSSKSMQHKTPRFFRGFVLLRRVIKIQTVNKSKTSAAPAAHSIFLVNLVALENQEDGWQPTVCHRVDFRTEA